MCEWGSASVTLFLFLVGVLGTTLLAWFSQNQRLQLMDGRLIQAEKGEKDCLDRERELNKRVTELERITGRKAAARKRR